MLKAGLQYIAMLAATTAATPSYVLLRLAGAEEGAALLYEGCTEACFDVMERTHRALGLGEPVALEMARDVARQFAQRTGELSILEALFPVTGRAKGMMLAGLFDGMPEDEPVAEPVTRFRRAHGA
jgi:hypothetical protein